MTEYISMGLAIGNLMMMVIVFYKLFHDPDEKAANQIGMSKVSCVEKHKRIDEIIVDLKEKIGSINKTLMLLRDNDIKHIEMNTYGLNEKMAVMQGKMDTMTTLMKDLLNKKQ